MGLANVFAALESGIRKFDASIAGCPFAPGASGNVATEDVVKLLQP
jgi:hydroxymethylglutaryl-CoA lyase